MRQQQQQLEGHKWVLANLWMFISALGALPIEEEVQPIASVPAPAPAPAPAAVSVWISDLAPI